jgi:hypothetical protein
MEKILKGECVVIQIDCKNSWYRKKIHEEAQKLGLTHETFYHDHEQVILTENAYKKMNEYNQLSFQDPQDDYYSRQIFRIYKSQEYLTRRNLSYVLVSGSNIIEKDILIIIPNDNLTNIILQYLIKRKYWQSQLIKK